MKKCLNAPITSKNLEHTQTVMRQLVSTNVLLKEQLDKQTEDKKVLRKKLFQMEKNQSEKDKFIMKKEHEHKELNEKYKQILAEYDRKKSELDSFKDSFKDSPRCSRDFLILKKLLHLFNNFDSQKSKFIKSSRDRNRR